MREVDGEWVHERERERESEREKERERERKMNEGTESCVLLPLHILRLHVPIDA